MEVSAGLLVLAWAARWVRRRTAGRRGGRGKNRLPLGGAGGMLANCMSDDPLDISHDQIDDFYIAIK